MHISACIIRVLDTEFLVIKDTYQGHYRICIVCKGNSALSIRDLYTRSCSNYKNQIWYHKDYQWKVRRKLKSLKEPAGWPFEFRCDLSPSSFGNFTELGFCGTSTFSIEESSMGMRRK